VLLRKQDPQFFTRHPGPEDIALLFEVAGTTFGFDRSTKYRLSARVGIQEYWIVDIPKRNAVVCRSPHGDDFHSVTILTEHETISPAAVPEFSFAVDQIFA
jgi:Uma2 family endonuclease